MSPLTFAMSTATLNFAQTFSYFIPPNSVEDHHSSLSHCFVTTLMADYIIPVLIQQQNLCYDGGDANPARIPTSLIPSLFCLSILETFIPHSKIYGTSNYWQHAECQLITFQLFCLLTTTTSTKVSFPTNLCNTSKLKTFNIFDSTH